MFCPPPEKFGRTIAVRDICPERSRNSRLKAAVQISAGRRQAGRPS
jgi:hypothetical protein